MSQADLAYRIIAIIFPVFSIVAIGYFYARLRRDTDMSSGNRINMDIFTPAVLNFLVAERFNQQPQQFASIVLIGNLASILVIPAILWSIL